MEEDQSLRREDFKREAASGAETLAALRERDEPRATGERAHVAEAAPEPLHAELQAEPAFRPLPTLQEEDSPKAHSPGGTVGQAVEEELQRAQELAREAEERELEQAAKRLEASLAPLTTPEAPPEASQPPAVSEDIAREVAAPPEMEKLVVEAEVEPVKEQVTDRPEEGPRGGDPDHRKAAALAALHHAKADKDSGQLAEAILAAERAGVPEPELQEAREVKANLDKKAKPAKGGGCLCGRKKPAVVE